MVQKQVAVLDVEEAVAIAEAVQRDAREVRP